VHSHCSTSRGRSGAACPCMATAECYCMATMEYVPDANKGYIHTCIYALYRRQIQPSSVGVEVADADAMEYSQVVHCTHFTISHFPRTRSCYRYHTTILLNFLLGKTPLDCGSGKMTGNDSSFPSSLVGCDCDADPNRKQGPSRLSSGAAEPIEWATCKLFEQLLLVYPCKFWS
jgi:hypothetical protein